MSFFQALALIVALTFLRFILKILFGGEFYHSSFGSAFASVISLGGMTFVTRRVFVKKNITFFPTSPVSNKVIVLAVSAILFLFLVITIVGSFEELLRRNSDDFFKGQFIFGWSVNMKRYYLSALLVAPIFEELFIRGLLLQGLLRRYSPVISILLTTIIFVSFHLDKDNLVKWDFNISYKISIVLLSIFVSWVTIKTLNIKVAILLHFIWNLMWYCFPLILNITGIDLSNPTSFFIFSCTILSGSSIMLGRTIMQLRSLMAGEVAR
jgi:membrane protease YdiL (CAAX protease family)